MVQVIEILPGGTQGPVYSALSVHSQRQSWLLMTLWHEIACLYGKQNFLVEIESELFLYFVITEQSEMYTL